MEFHEQVREARLKKGLTRKEAADLIGMNPKSYASVERGDVTCEAPTAQQVRDSGLFTNRIADIKNFYERLDSVCDESGRIVVDENHPVLQELRSELGVESIVYSRKEFGERLRQIREEKGITQHEAARMAGLPLTGYTSYEYGFVKGKGKNYHKIISSDLFK